VKYIITDKHYRYELGCTPMNESRSFPEMSCSFPEINGSKRRTEVMERTSAFVNATI
jgi:hypothetical protein